jgi:uncharacterized protein Veg
VELTVDSVMMEESVQSSVGDSVTGKSHSGRRSTVKGQRGILSLLTDTVPGPAECLRTGVTC